MLGQGGKTIKQTPFREFVLLCENLRKTTKKHEKISIISSFLRRIGVEEVSPAVNMVIGLVSSGGKPLALNIPWKTIEKAARVVQTRLVAQPLTILRVFDTLTTIAETMGPGSEKKKENMLASLLSQATPEEQICIKKIIFGEMRHGVGEGLILEAIASHANTSLDQVRQAYMFLGDVGETARVAITQGGEALRSVGITLFRPIKPMLAETVETPGDALREHGGTSFFEYKYDGARVQIHKEKDEIRIYTRRLSDVTSSIPEIVEAVRGVDADTTILEGEVLALGEGGKPYPFQELMRRFRRVSCVEEMVETIPLKLFLYDILQLEGKPLVKEPFSKRREILEETATTELISKGTYLSSSDEAQKLLEEAIKNGHEGLMAKNPGSIYTPGSRGKGWLKIKPVKYLDLVIVAADWGHGRRRGWLSNYHLAAYNPETGGFEVVGKTFKGLTDNQFETLTKQLLALKKYETPYTVYVKPSIVVEIAYNEIQRSPQYTSRYAIRFARVKRIREDKKPEDADTITKIRELYQSQFRYKAQLVGPTEKPNNHDKPGTEYLGGG